MVVDPVVYSPLSCGPQSSYADFGIQEKVVSSEDAHDVVFLPVIDTLADADKIKSPIV